MHDHSRKNVRASHILVKDGAQCAALRSEILGGADFAALASQHSTCPSGKSGGSLGVFGRGQMVKEFEEAAFTQEVGKVGACVGTQFGYHLILVEERLR